MPPATTRTLNPLPFNALEPKRFEDLVRQLAYDFRRWRMLEATGRAGGDGGFDARGFEVTTDDSGTDVDPLAEEHSNSIAIEDRLWLIQCKRERTIGPSKMRQHLREISEDEARGLYGVIFAAACDFSMATRAALHLWCRERGILEIHIWGKGEIEDQLFQPKNDHLLFAYFGISLQIRRRSARTTLRSMLTMKRKAMRHLGDGKRESKIILLRDPEDGEYPYVGEDVRDKYRWCLSIFSGNETGHIKLHWRSFRAFLHPDGFHWDCGNVQNYNFAVDLEDAWIGQEERDRRHKLDREIEEFWYSELRVDEQATFNITGYFKYDEILEIDEKGDNAAPFPHVYVPFKDGRPAFSFLHGRLTANGVQTFPEEGPVSTERRVIHNPSLEHRVERFPSRFRKRFPGEK